MPGTVRALTPRAQRREEALLDAAFAELVEAGWAGLVPARIAARASCSITPVRKHFGDRSGAAVALWENRLAARLLSSLSEVTDVLESSPMELPGAVTRFLAPFIEPDPYLQAAIELAIASAYDPDLAAAVRYAFDGEFERWLTPHARGTSSTVAAQRATLIAIALGLAVSAPLAGGRRLDLKPPSTKLAAALTSPSRPARLPADAMEHLDRGFVFETGDPITDAVLRAALETVGEVGYEAASTERMARRSGYTQGALFARYPTKAALFLDATARDAAAAASRNAAIMEKISIRRSPGIAEAFFIRESMSHGRGMHRVVLLEQLRLARTQPHIAGALEAAIAPARASIEGATPGTAAQKSGAVQIEVARGNGPVLLALLAPTAWNLPYDVVTVPLQDDAK